MTATEQNIRNLIFWGQLLLVGGVTLRTMIELLKSMDDLSELPTLWKRNKKRVIAVIIAITIESTVIWIKSFYT